MGGGLRRLAGWGDSRIPAFASGGVSGLHIIIKEAGNEAAKGKPERLDSDLMIAIL
jgi:hypothetical protein